MSIYTVFYSNARKTNSSFRTADTYKQTPPIYAISNKYTARTKTHKHVENKDRQFDDIKKRETTLPQCNIS